MAKKAEDQEKENEKAIRKLKKLERRRLALVKNVMGEQAELAELKLDIAELRRTYQVISYRNFYRNSLSNEDKRELVKSVKKCEKCGTKKDLTVHHKKSLVEGGTNIKSNLEVLCLKCHQELHMITPRSIVEV